MSYKYYMRENVTGATTYDLETDFKGLRCLRTEGLEKYGDIKNVFEREYVEEQNIDYLYPTTPTFKPTTITFTFGVFERFITDSTPFATAKDAFLEYIATKNIIYWDTYRNKRAFMYRDGELDVMEDIRRNGDSYIRVTVKYKNTKGYVDNYDINNIMSFDTTWNVQSISPSITLPFYGTSPNEEVYIDWGDESEVETIAPMTIIDDYTLIQHTYSVFNSATKIRIWSASTTSTSVGKMPVWSFYRVDQSIMDIISADTPFQVFYEGITPYPYLEYLFYSCRNLQSVHVDLLKYNTQATSLYVAFYNTSITVLPKISYLPLLINVEYCFGETKITSIPNNYFDNNINIERMTGVFVSCEFLLTTPKYLLRYQKKCAQYRYMFDGCIRLKIDKDIFCDSLTEKNTRFATLINNYVGTGIVYFERMFYRSSFLGTEAGEAPDLWNYYSPMYANESQFFSGAGNSITSISNYADIPSSWGGTATYYTIDVTQPTGATITTTAWHGNSVVKSGSNITFNITANEGYGLTAIVTNEGSYSSAPTFTFTNVTSNKTLTATAGLLEFEIETFAGTGGTITSSETVYAFTNKTITITPNTKFSIQRVEVDGVNMGKITSYTFTNILSDHTVRAYFQEIIQFKTTWEIPSNGYNLYLPFTSNIETRTSPNETVYIDWGDGDDIQEISSLTVLTSLIQKHLYASAGIYQVSIWSETSTGIVAGKMPFWDGTTAISYNMNNQLISIDTPILPMYNGTIVKTDLSYIFAASAYLVTVCDRLTYYINNVITSMVSSFEGCSRLEINKDIFIDDENERYTTFSGRTIDFTECFTRSSFLGTTAGTAPQLWDYSGTHTGTDCFLGYGNSTLSNVDYIPTSWGGTGTYYTITILQSIGGYITPTGKNGNIYIGSGLTATITITPLSGKSVQDVLVDGASQGAITSYEFANVTANHIITAVFI